MRKPEPKTASVVHWAKSGAHGMSRFGRLTAVVVVWALAATLPASASPDDEMPLLFSGETDKGVWVSHRITTDGATVVTDIEAFAERGSTQVGGLVYDAENHLVFGYIGTSYGHTSGMYVDGRVGDESVHVDWTEPDSVRGYERLALTLNPEDSSGGLRGTFKVLMWFAGAAERIAYAVRGESGAAYHGSKSGHDTFVFSSRDFNGAATASVGSGGLAGIRANLATVRAVDIDDTLVGQFVGGGLSGNLMSVVGPRGTQDCPPSLIGLGGCLFWAVAGGDRHGEPLTPGTYTFNLTGLGAGGGNGEVVLAGADARIPVEADLELSAIDLSGLSPDLKVGEQLQVSVVGSAVNHGPWGRMDVSVDVVVPSTAGLTVTTEEATPSSARLGLGEEQALRATLTITCDKPGNHNLVVEGRIRPAESVDIDSNAANDAAAVSSSVRCKP